MRRDLEQATICVIGLGYVGLPLAEAFSKKLKVIGFDTDSKRDESARCKTQPKFPT